MGDGKRQIMISYQWDSKTEVMKLYEALIVDGYKVWIDKERMHGDINDRMAEAVKDSSIILLCMTKKYEESQNCKKEYTFADECKKRIIPIYFEEDYKAGGGLAIIIAGKRYFNFRRKEKFDSEFCNLKVEIRKQLEELGECKIFILQNQYSTLIRKIFS